MGKFAPETASKIRRLTEGLELIAVHEIDKFGKFPNVIISPGRRALLLTDNVKIGLNFT